MASTSEDHVFVTYLKEIEKGYVGFPKPLRLRIERWVEKLVLTSGMNSTWRRHRNAYAKLLLSMVLSKNISEPFHQNPPDGPLQSFPTQLNHKFKGIVGVHESTFWRELFRTVDEKTERGTSENSRSDIDKIIDKELNSKGPHSREIHNLTLLIREQASRIQLLEEQLHEERIKHELQIQRLLYAHRVELSNLQNTATSIAGANGSVHDRQDNPASVGLSFSRSPERSRLSLNSTLPHSISRNNGDEAADRGDRNLRNTRPAAAEILNESKQRTTEDLFPNASIHSRPSDLSVGGRAEGFTSRRPSFKGTGGSARQWTDIESNEDDNSHEFTSSVEQRPPPAISVGDYLSKVNSPPPLSKTRDWHRESDLEGQYRRPSVMQQSASVPEVDEEADQEYLRYLEKFQEEVMSLQSAPIGSFTYNT